MRRLGHGRLRRLVAVLRALDGAEDLDTLGHRLVHALPGAVPADITTYNEVNRRAGRVRAFGEPAEVVDFPKLAPVFTRHMREHPLLRYYGRTSDRRAVKISDFLTRRQFEATVLYGEYYRALGTRHQIAVGLPAALPVVIGVALSRQRRDFTEDDRLVLDLLRSHLLVAYEAVQALQEARAALALVGQAVDGAGHGLVVLGRAGRISVASDGAIAWLTEFLGGRDVAAGRLPERLWAWAREEMRRRGGEPRVGSPAPPFTVEVDGARLVVRLVTDGPRAVLVLRRQATTLDARGLMSLGLTAREAQTLTWVAEGKTNEEIGSIIDARPRTVAKHLQSIFVKLGVETRTAAAARARSAITTP